MKKYLRGTPKERFLNRVNMDGPIVEVGLSQCWEWLGKGEYLYLSKGKYIGISRFSYKTFVGDIPERGMVYRKCLNEKCVNPDHLFLGTRGGNSRRARPVAFVDGIMHKRCVDCNGLLPWTREFYYSAGEGHLRSSCIECCKKLSKQRKVDAWEYYLWLEAKSSSKTRNLEFSIIVDDIKELYVNQNGECYWFGIELEPSLKPKHPYQPSIDRLDNSKGYTKDNIVLCCYSANIGRNRNTADDWKIFLFDVLLNLDMALWRGEYRGL